MGTSILFVDDEPDLELLIRQKYRRWGRSKDLEIDFAGNGHEALAKIRARTVEYDLIFTDINMPEMDGLTLLQEICDLDLTTLVIILSAYGNMSNIRSAMNRGAFDFLTKPIDFKDLEATEKKALRHLGLLRERVRLAEDKEQLEERVAFVQETFGRYLSSTVVQALIDDPKGLYLGGEKREVSILMSDLRGFSAMCERLSPEQVVSILNNYFSVMIDIIIDHDGTIDEIIGDAMLVIFGAPLAQPDHADRAIRCAVAMQRAMQSVNERSLAQGLEGVEMGIGINTGEVVVGNIGSQRRAKYAVVGSNVNLASRIESLAQGGQIMICESTRRSCRDALELNEGLSCVFKGLTKPVTVYELFGTPGDIYSPVSNPNSELREQESQTGLAENVSSSTPETVTKLRRDLELTRDKLENQDQLASLGLMAVGIAHEIKNPLSFISTFADLSYELVDELEEFIAGQSSGDISSGTAITGDLRLNLGKIRKHGHRAHEFVKSMVEGIHVEKTHRHEFQLNSTLTSPVDLLYYSLCSQAPSMRVRIDKDFDDSIGTVVANKQDIIRVILNLVQNAFEAVGERARRDPEMTPQIRITTRNVGDTVEIRVRDNGDGIPESIREKIFEPFFTTKREGTGLGLALVLEVVRAHHGTLRLESQEGNCTEFVLVIPKVAGPALPGDVGDEPLRRKTN